MYLSYLLLSGTLSLGNFYKRVWNSWTKFQKAQETGAVFANFGHSFGKPWLDSLVSVTGSSHPCPCPLLSQANSSWAGSGFFTPQELFSQFFIQIILLWVWQMLKSAAWIPVAPPCSAWTRDEVECVWGSLKKGTCSEESPVPEITDTEERPGCLRRGRNGRKPMANTLIPYIFLSRERVLMLDHTHALLSLGQKCTFFYYSLVWYQKDPRNEANGYYHV